MGEYGAEEDGREGDEEGGGFDEEEGGAGAVEGGDGPGKEDPESHVGGRGEVDPVGEFVLVVDEVHFRQQGVRGFRLQGEAEEGYGEEVEEEDEGDPQAGEGGIAGFDVPGGEDGEEDVEGGAGVDERREVEHVGEAVHFVEAFLGGVHGAPIGTALWSEFSVLRRVGLGGENKQGRG